MPSLIDPGRAQSSGSQFDPLGLIAVVDDDSAVRHSLALVLSVIGRDAATFGSAADFLATDTASYSRILLDYHMPRMTGLELAEHIRAEGYDTPIMLMSGGLTASIADKASLLGIWKVHAKPVDLGKIREFIEA